MTANAPVNHLSIVSVIDAPASALNGSDQSLDNYENSTAVKVIRTVDGKSYPYVSAQSYRHHLRLSLAMQPGAVISAAAQVGKIAFSDSDPVTNWDDDLLGYMRAPGKAKPAGAPKGRGKAAAAKVEPDAQDASVDPVDEEVAEKKQDEPITRTSPLRSGTLVAMSPVRLTEDFGTMTRHLQHEPEGGPAAGEKPWAPVPHSHNFYRATLLAPMSLVLGEIGRFTTRRTSGQHHIRAADVAKVMAGGQVTQDASGRLVMDANERAQRAAALVRALATVDGGAKQNLHYTDTRPRILIMAAVPGAPNPFQYVLVERVQGTLEVDEGALRQALAVYGARFVTPLGIDWIHGYNDAARVVFERIVAEAGLTPITGHPQQVAEAMATYIATHPEIMG